MRRAFLALFLMLLPALPWLFSGGLSEKHDADECFAKLMKQKDEFERKHPGTIVDPDFGGCVVERYLQYVQGYEGGQCFFLRNISGPGTGRLIQGIGTQVQPFETFYADFKRDNGIEAQINLALVTPFQCPAITFLRSLQRDRLEGKPAYLEIEQDSLRAGDPLRGSTDKWSGLVLELLLVDETGRLHNVTSQLDPDPNKFSFELRWPTRSSPARQPQMLLAINSTARLDAFRFDQSDHADHIFGRALKEARDKGLMLGISPIVFWLEGQTPPR
jgi:hypothetical protein